MFHCCCFVCHQCDVSLLLFCLSSVWCFIVVVLSVISVMFHCCCFVCHQCDVSLLLFCLSSVWCFIVVVLSVISVMVHCCCFVCHQCDGMYCYLIVISDSLRSGKLNCDTLFSSSNTVSPHHNAQIKIKVYFLILLKAV
jgi:hypothetical protein